MKPFPLSHPYLQKYVTGHLVQVLRNGAETFPAMLEAIRGAKKNICFETYILAADKTGEKFAAALIERAQAGLEVNLIYDSIGSFGLPAAFVKKLQDGGVRTLEYNPIRWYTVTQWNRRNHRKSLIVDSKVCFVGGINISDEYAPAEEGGGNWRDTHIRIEGPAALDLEAIFLRTWHRAKGAKTSPQRYGQCDASPGEALVRIIGNRQFRERRKIRAAYLRAIMQAEKRICITNAYFLPDPPFVRALGNALKRGVDVSIILGGTSSDVPWVGYAGRAAYGNLLKRGIKLYEWKKRVLHAKTAVVDQIWSTVGSYNLDYRSLLHNLEVNAGVIDAKFGADMEEMFDEDLKTAEQITYEEWKNRSLWNRIRDWIAYRFRFFL